MSATSHSHWDERYRSLEPDFTPAALVVNAVSLLTPGRALDLACGAGGNALWLAEPGWQVTAVDASAVAINLLHQEAARRALVVKTLVADLETGKLSLDAGAWELIVISKYFQRDLFVPVKQAVATGGLVITSALLQEPGKKDSPFRVQRGELRGFFGD